MKQVLKAVGFVLLLLTSCSKDDSNPNNGNGNGNGNGNVTPPVEQKAIVITSYSKNYGYAGDSVDILGENFPKKEQCKVTFGDTEATITSVSADGKKLTLVLPRSSTYLPELKFYFGEKTVVDNKVTNDYEQKIANTGGFSYLSDFYITPSHEGLNVDFDGVYKVPIGGTKTPNPFINSGKRIFSKRGVEFNRVICDDEMKNIIIVSIRGDVYKSTNGKDFYPIREANLSETSNVDYQWNAFKRDINHIWIAGLSSRKDKPKILFCNGNNEQWTEYVFEDKFEWAVAVDFPTNQIGYCLISGSVNKIYKSTDGGYSWQKLPFEIPIGVRSLAFQDELYAFADDGLLYRYYFK